MDLLHSHKLARVRLYYPGFRGPDPLQELAPPLCDGPAYFPAFERPDKHYKKIDISTYPHKTQNIQTDPQ